MTITAARPAAHARAEAPSPEPARILRRLITGTATLFWTALVVVPVYWVLITSLRRQGGFVTTPPLSLRGPLTLDNYRRVLADGFTGYLINSVTVTLVAGALTVVVSFAAAFTIVRFTSAWSRLYFRLFLLGLAIPLQAVIIPVYLLIIRMHLYDSLAAIILPSAAFAVPVTVLILVTFLRDVPGSLFEAMVVDGASEFRILWSLAVPLARPALVTVAVYDVLQVWNGFLFPLILTQSPERAVLPLALANYHGQYGIDVPSTMAAVVLSTLPILAVFILGRRQLVAGLTAGFSK